MSPLVIPFPKASLSLTREGDCVSLITTTISLAASVCSLMELMAAARSSQRSSVYAH